LQLTFEAVDAIAASIQLGAFKSSAVLSQGFTRRAYQRWDRVGAKALRKPESDRSDSEKVYAYFVDKTRRAEGSLQCEAASIHYSQAQSDAEVMERFLAKRFPETWGAPATTKAAEIEGPKIEYVPLIAQANVAKLATG
jgi:hypothetical protein